MAVSRMKMISIIGLNENLDEVVETCGRSHIFHPDDALKFYPNSKNFTRVSDKNMYAQALQALKENVSGAGKTLTLVDVENFDVSYQQITEYIRYLSEKLSALLEKQKAIKSKIAEYKKNLLEVSHFSGLPIDLREMLSCKYVKFSFGSLPKDSYKKLTSYSENSDFLFFACTHDEHQYWGLYLAPIDKIEEVDRLFANLYFKPTSLSLDELSPEVSKDALEEKIAKEEENLAALEKKIDAFWKVQYEQCMRFYSKLEELSTYFEIKKYAYKYKRSFILIGWIPQEREREFLDALDTVDGIEYSLEDGKDELEFSPPIKLKNKKIFKPFEFFVDMYGLPSYDEVDPTAFVAITYTLLFGIMFADLGQGLLLSLVGYFMWRLKKMQLGKILVPCGISSAIFGAVFGSVFGFEHALDGFYQRVFGLEEKPIEVMETSMTNTIIYSAVGIGVALVLLSMCVNVYSSLKRRQFGNALFSPSGVAGIVLYGGAVFAGVSSILLKINVFTPAYIVGVIVLPFVCILLREILAALVDGEKDWKPESFKDYITQNLFESLEILLSYVTNTMSFLRVGAFVLVHAGMMLVVFTLAEMGNDVSYVLVVTVGNLFVVALEALLVGIQVLRLNFYEMFSRFFEGQGRKFEPIVVDGSK